MHHSTPDVHDCNMQFSAVSLTIIVIITIIQSGFCDVDDDGENRVIVNYETDTHSRYEYGIPGKSVKGYYTSKDANGRVYRVNYVADEKGYRAYGEHLPHSNLLEASQKDDEITASQGSLILNNEKLDKTGLPAEEEEVEGRAPASTSEMSNIVNINVKKDDDENDASMMDQLIIHVPSLKVKTLQSSTSQDTISMMRARSNRKTSSSAAIKRPIKKSKIFRYKLAFMPFY